MLASKEALTNCLVTKEAKPGLGLDCVPLRRTMADSPGPRENEIQ